MSLKQTARRSAGSLQRGVTLRGANHYGRTHLAVQVDVPEAHKFLLPINIGLRRDFDKIIVKQLNGRGAGNTFTAHVSGVDILRQHTTLADNPVYYLGAPSLTLASLNFDYNNSGLLIRLTVNTGENRSRNLRFRLTFLPPVFSSEITIKQRLQRSEDRCIELSQDLITEKLCNKQLKSVIRKLNSPTLIDDTRVEGPQVKPRGKVFDFGNTEFTPGKLAESSYRQGDTYSWHFHPFFEKFFNSDKFSGAWDEWLMNASYNAHGLNVVEETNVFGEPDSWKTENGETRRISGI